VFCLRALCPPFQQGGDIVRGCHSGTAPGSGKRGIAITGCDVQHAFIPADVACFGQLLTNNLQGRADDSVVAASPGNLLSAFNSHKVYGYVHGVELLLLDALLWVLAPTKSCLSVAFV
jgi:hypothetical protein